MTKLNKTLEEYKSNNGWSSLHFASNAIELITELERKGVKISIGRTVLHLRTPKTCVKAYVHHNGRSEEYATITDWRGNELITVHYTNFEELAEFLRKKLT